MRVIKTLLYGIALMFALVCGHNDVLAQPATVANPGANAETGIDEGPASEVKSDFAGHYFLDGVPGAGSELLLRRNGKFEYYISYGSVDQESVGTWMVLNNTIVLTSQQRHKSTPLFVYASVDPWTPKQDAAYTMREWQKLSTAASVRCPFLAYSDSALTTSIVDDAFSDAQAVNQISEDQRVAARNQAPEYFARAAQGRQLAQEGVAAFAKHQPGSEAWREASVRVAQSILTFDELVVEARAVARSAEIPMDPSFKPLDYSQACGLPETASLLPTPEPQIALSIVDPERGIEMREVDVTFEFTDGSILHDKTNDDGIAFAPVNSNVPLKSVTLHHDNVPGAHASFATPLNGVGAINVALDISSLIPPSFDKKILVVDGDVLIAPEWGGAGRYSKY